MNQEDRLKIIVDEIEKSHKEIARELGYSRAQSISDNLKADKATNKFIAAICSQYGYNPEWVKTGKGSKRSNSPTNKNEGALIEASNDETLITKAGMQFIPNKGGSYTMLTPHITEYGYGGYLLGFSDEKYVAEMPTFPVVVNELHRGAYISITMKGDSMDDGTRDSIMEGDVLTGRFIQRHLWEDTAIHFKRHRYFIIHHIEGIIIKQITEHDVAGKRIKIHSLNPDKEMYPDDWIDLTKVKELFNVTHKSQKM